MKRRAAQEMRRFGAVTPSSVCFTASAFLRGGGGIYFKPMHLRGGGGACLIETGRLFERKNLFNLETTMVSVRHKELEYKVEKLKDKKL